MNSRKWRNPYAPLNKKSGQPAKLPGAAPAALALNTKKSPLPFDLRSSVSRMRNNIKGISSTIRQMEETMDTLYGAMEMVESLGRQGGRTSAPAHPSSMEHHSFAPRDEVETEENHESNHALPNIDMGQLLQLLQSPLVQSLISQHLGSSTKRKKEG